MANRVLRWQDAWTRHASMAILRSPGDPERSHLGTKRMGNQDLHSDEALQHIVGAVRDWLDVAQDRNTGVASEIDFVRRKLRRQCAVVPHERHMMLAAFALGIKRSHDSLYLTLLASWIRQPLRQTTKMRLKIARALPANLSCPQANGRCGCPLPQRLRSMLGLVLGWGWASSRWKAQTYAPQHTPLNSVLW